MTAGSWDPTLRPAFAWREARRRGGDDVARGAITHGLDTRATWAAITDEHTLARMALDGGRLDLRGLVTRAIAAATASEKRGAGRELGEELVDAFDRVSVDDVEGIALEDRMRLAALASRVHAALAAGTAWAALAWAADAALVATDAAGADDARFAALEALRAVGTNAPGRVERWAEVCPFAPAFDPSASVALVVEPFDGSHLIGYRKLRPDVDEHTAFRAFAALLDDRGIRLTTFPAPVAVEVGGVTWIEVPRRESVAAWQRWIEVVVERTHVAWRWHVPPRTDGEKRAAIEAVDLALEKAIGESTWALAFRTLQRVYKNREPTIHATWSEDEKLCATLYRCGWHPLLVGTPSSVAASLREQVR
jgi:hypothetical protein